MALKQNIIYIYFKGKHLVTSKSQYQYNHGQFLYFADLDLPQAFEVHFSNKDKGYSKPQVGSNKLVEIPDEYYWSGAQMIYAWIYLHSDIDDGETVYEVRIPLIKRAEPTDEQPLPQQESAMERAIAELNTAVEITTENANKTGEDRAQVSDIRDEVVDLKENIDATAETVTQKAQDAVDASRRSEESAQNAAEFEEGAHRYSEDSKQYAQEALESKNTAKQKADVATDASAEALGYKNEALDAKNQAEQAKQNIVDYRDETKGYRNETLSAKNDVQTIKGDVQSLKTQIDKTATDVATNALDAKSSADLSYRSAISADNASLSASQFADEASDFADSASQSASQAEEFKNQSATNVTHYPKVIDGYWYVWDASKSDYVNTNVDARGIKGDKGDIGKTGNGIENTVLNSDYTLTITFTDGTSYTTTSIRGEKGIKGDVGNGIASTVLNNDYTLTINFTDGTQYTTPPIRGKQGEKGERGEKGDKGDTGEVTTEEFLKAFVTDSASGSIASFSDGANDLPLKSLIVDIDPVQDLHGQNSPYPAGGGVNKFNPFQGTHNGVTWTTQSDGTSKITGTASNAGWKNLYEIYDLPWRGISAGDSVVVYSDVYMILQTWENDTWVTKANPANRYVTVTIPSNVTKIRIIQYPESVPATEGETYDIVAHYYIAKGSTFTSWSPYENICPISGWTQVNVSHSDADMTNPTTITIDLGQTVYGGKLDVLTGILTVYPYYASYNGETLTGRWISDRDVYAVGTTPTIGAQVVNIGAEGTEIQLEPHEVKSLLGANNIFADTGDTACEYRADTTLYISRLTEPDADMVADANIVSGQYFMVGNSLFKATANIANGAQIIVGTNCIRKSLSEALNEINV